MVAAATGNPEIRGMSIRRIWFSFEGRMGRKDYWLKFVLPYNGIWIVIAILDGTVGTFISAYSAMPEAFSLSSLLANSLFFDLMRPSWPGSIPGAALIVTAILTGIYGSAAPATSEILLPPVSETVLLISLLVKLALLWPGFAAGAKRCHDRNRSGWSQAVLLIPGVGAIWQLVELGFLKGTDGENRFGRDPLAG